MDDNVKKLRNYFESLFNSELYSRAYIEVMEREEVVLSANREGLLYLVDKIILLCEQKTTGSHYHLDESGMADKCEKPIIIQLKKAPWD